MIDAVRLQWLLTQLRARAQPPLPAGLVPLHMAGVQVGLVQPAAAHLIAGHVAGFALSNGALHLSDTAADAVARSALLADAARALEEAAMIRGWRNELLAVGRPAVAAIERAACRPLGITTEAVHLNAYSSDATEEMLTVAQRSPHKQIDPGLWDNLVGGMVPAGETLAQALEREAWEEAGLRIDALSLTRGRCFHTQRPVPEGLQSEIIHVWDAQLAPTAALRNRDGEVAAIERRSVAAVVDQIERGQFTLESALATLESLLRRRGHIASDFFETSAAA